MIKRDEFDVYIRWTSGAFEIYFTENQEDIDRLKDADPFSTMVFHRPNKGYYAVVAPAIKGGADRNVVEQSMWSILRRYSKENPCPGVLALRTMAPQFTVPDPLDEARGVFISQVRAAAGIAAHEAIKSSPLGFDDAATVKFCQDLAHDTAANIMDVLDGHPGDPLIGHGGYYLMPNDMLANKSDMPPPNLAGDLAILFLDINT